MSSITPSRLRLHYFARRAGVAGAIGASVLSFAGGYYLSVVRPLSAQVEEVRERVASYARMPLDRGENGKAPPGNDRLMAKFPGHDDITICLRNIYAAAHSQKIELHHGEYKLTEEGGGAFAHLAIALPVTGEYVQLRRFIAKALFDVPALALDEVKVDLQTETKGTAIEANLRFTLFVRKI